MAQPTLQEVLNLPQQLSVSDQLTLIASITAQLADEFSNGELAEQSGQKVEPRITG